MNKLQLNTNKLFLKNLEAFNNKFRYIINTGGTSSGKTYTILQLIIYICLNQKVSVSIVRNSLPALRKSAMGGPGGFFDILNTYGIYDESMHIKTENKYTFPTGSYVEFFGVVDGQRTRGARRDILFCNEANELSLEEFLQLRMRTKICCFLDRNPSEVDHWIDELINDERSYHTNSTYKDNRFLDENLKNDIESLIDVDPTYYRIYALGLPPTDNVRIYSHFKQFTEYPDYSDWCYGLDFGFTHATALVKCIFANDGSIYVDEVLYEKGITPKDLIELMKLRINNKRTIYCDSARPDLIEELRRAGFSAKLSDKTVSAGIDSIRSKRIFVSSSSLNIWKEYRSYMWRTGPNGKPIDEPIKLNDDCMDAMRYAINTHRRHSFDINKPLFY